MSVEARATPLRSTLAERLDAAVRPEFRVDVLVPAVGDPILGTPACMVPGYAYTPAATADSAWPIWADGNAPIARMTRGGQPGRIPK